MFGYRDTRLWGFLFVFLATQGRIYFIVSWIAVDISTNHLSLAGKHSFEVKIMAHSNDRHWTCILFSSYDPTWISNIQKDKVIWLKSYIWCVVKLSISRSKNIYDMSILASFIEFIKLCRISLILTLHF